MGDRGRRASGEPPPRLDEGTAVAAETLAKVFDAIPGARYPRHHARPLRLAWSAGPGSPAPGLQLTAGPAYGSLVSAVDADGNEVAGIALPELRVPLATHTGWNLRHPDIGGAEQLLVFAGATIPFPPTRREREATGDPRPSIAERYGSRETYLAGVCQAALALVGARYLLEEDVELSVQIAARMWDHYVGTAS